MFPGKVPKQILETIVFKHLGVKRKEVLFGPGIGEDAAIVKIKDEIFAISTDPITGAEERIGWLAVNVSANDVACRGAIPIWFTSCILLPERSDRKLIEMICKQIDEACYKLGIAVIAGHCEVTPGLTRPIVIGCSIGKAPNGKFVTTSGARLGDKIILTKGAGIEGTAILASDRKGILKKHFNEEFIKRAEGFFEKVSVVKDAKIAFSIGGVTAMHDPTEGGIAGGLHELSDASKGGFVIHKEKIHIAEETKKICKFFKIDPLRLISSGSLLITSKREYAKKIVDALLENGIHASIIGTVKEKKYGRLIHVRRRKRRLIRPRRDDLWKALVLRL